MKKYIKPIVEMKEFKSMERIADLSDFNIRNDNSGIEVTSENITSYYFGS